MINLEQEFSERLVEERLNNLTKWKVEIAFNGLSILRLFLLLKEAIIELPLNDPTYESIMQMLLELEETVLKLEPDLEPFLYRLTVLNEGDDDECQQQDRTARRSSYRLVRASKQRQ